MASWQGDDHITLHLIATGLLYISQRIEKGYVVNLPYPANLQRGVNRLAASCLKLGQTPPQNLTDLFSWCHQPLQSWPLTLFDEELGQNDSFLQNGRVTEVCEEWAVVGGDIEADLMEQAFFKKFVQICREAQSQADYVAGRKWLIENPVLTAFELQSLRFLHPLIADSLFEVYEPVPAVHAKNEYFLTCAHCGGLLLKTSSGQWQCEHSRCQYKGRKPEKEQYLKVKDQVLWLERSIRRFITAPGLAELKLQKQLEKLDGVQVNLWPNFDAYDLQVQFDNGECWAVDVKDWCNPVLLARSTTALPPSPPWNKSFYVFPDQHRQQRADYARAFNSYSQHTRGLMMRDFMKEVRRKLSREQKNA